MPRYNAESRALNDFCSSFNFTQLINKPTRVTENGESLIDVVMTTNEKLIASNGRPYVNYQRSQPCIYLTEVKKAKDQVLLRNY